MRLSSIRDDVGYARNCFNVKIYLEDVQVRFSVVADEEQGYIEVYEEDGQGNIVVNEDGTIPTKRIFGRVRIELPDGWFRIT
jgi:hypothetical protein